MIGISGKFILYKELWEIINNRVVLYIEGEKEIIIEGIVFQFFGLEDRMKIIIDKNMFIVFSSKLMYKMLFYLIIKFV